MEWKPSRVLQLFGSIIAIAFTTGSLVHAQVQLKYRYEPGQTRYYELKQTLGTVSHVSDREITNHIAQHLQIATTVNEVEKDGSAVLAKSIVRVQMEATQPGSDEPMTYDSASGNEATGPFGMIANTLSSLVKKQILITVSEQGDIRKVDIPQELLQQFSGNGPGLTGLNTPEGVEKMLSQGSVIFPDKTLNVGDQWTRNMSTELPFGKMNSTIVFTYAGRTKDGLDRINATTKISLEPKPGSPFQVQMKASDGEGVYLFDTRRGCILASGLKQTMNLEISAIGQKLEQTVTTDISMRLVNPNQTAQGPK